MKKGVLIAVYGTLRRGEGNHRYFSKGLDYQATTKLAGYALYNLGWYPIAILSDNDSSIVVEMLYADVNTYNNITSMELGAGYYRHKISFENNEAFIYLQKPERVVSLPLIISGDWCKRFAVDNEYENKER